MPGDTLQLRECLLLRAVISLQAVAPIRNAGGTAQAKSLSCPRTWAGWIPVTGTGMREIEVSLGAQSDRDAHLPRAGSLLPREHQQALEASGRLTCFVERPKKPGSAIHFR